MDDEDPGNEYRNSHKANNNRGLTISLLVFYALGLLAALIWQLANNKRRNSYEPPVTPEKSKNADRIANCSNNMMNASTV